MNAPANLIEAIRPLNQNPVSKTGAGFMNFMTALVSSISADKALMIRPAQRIFFETGADGLLMGF